MKEDVESIALEEFKRQWPSGDEGRMAARLLRRYLVTRMIHSAKAAKCTELRSQAEAASSKLFAALLFDFEELGKTETTPKTIKVSPALNRFQNQPGKTEASEKK